jgi:hypothetical protein
MRSLRLLWPCLALVIALAACGEDRGADRLPTWQGEQGSTAPGSRDEGDGGADPTFGRTGPLPDGKAASCVENYSPAAVARRAFAFDGVVVDIGRSVSDRGGEGDLGLAGVTFEVNEWFSGGSEPTVTVDMQGAGQESAGKSEVGQPYGIGSRLLVSGEARWGGPDLASPIAWNCGFTRYYDADTASAWSDAVDFSAAD